MATQRFKEKLIDWQVLHDNLMPRLTDMPQLTADHAALGQVLTQTQDLENRQDAARAALRGVNEQRKQLSNQGTNARNRLAAGLRFALGAENPELVGFNINPRPRTTQRKRLSAAEKAARAATRATARAAAAKAAEKETPLPILPTTP
jgi:hypothetical protein